MTNPVKPNLVFYGVFEKCGPKMRKTRRLTIESRYSKLNNIYLLNWQIFAELTGKAHFAFKWNKEKKIKSAFRGESMRRICYQTGLFLQARWSVGFWLFAGNAVSAKARFTLLLSARLPLQGRDFCIILSETILLSDGTAITIFCIQWFPQIKMHAH